MICLTIKFQFPGTGDESVLAASRVPGAGELLDRSPRLGPHTLGRKVCSVYAQGHKNTQRNRRVAGKRA